MGSIAQEESINMGESMAWGRRKYAERGIIRTGKVNYGYRSDRHGQWSIVEEEAAVVRRMNDADLAGKNLGELCGALTADAVPTPNRNST